MNLQFIRVDYPRLKARIKAIEQGEVSGSGVQPGDLAIVAFSGDYNDLLNLPILFSGDYNDLINQPVIPPPNNTIVSYVSEFEVDLYIYSGFILNLVPTIKRVKDSVVEYTQGVTNLPTDWANRLSLTYI